MPFLVTVTWLFGHWISISPQWECLNYGAPGEGLAYVESFAVDTSDCQVVVQFGTNDIYQLNDENIDEYVERYVKAVLAVPSLKTYLFCIFPRNDYDDYSTAVNKFIQILNRKIHEKLQGTDIVYLDVFNRLLQDGRLNPELTLDDLHLNGKGVQYSDRSTETGFRFVKNIPKYFIPCFYL